MQPAIPPQSSAWITGASSGIGAAFARRLAQDGHPTVLIARREHLLEALAAELPGEHRVLAADLSDEGELARVAHELKADTNLGLLVNNAGFMTHGPLEQQPWSGERDQVRVLVEAVTRLTQAALPSLRARRSGAIIQVSSIAAFRPHPDLATYSGCKGFVNAFTLALSDALQGSGVQTTAVCPGPTHTEIFDAAGVDLAGHDKSRWLQPEQVVEAALKGLRKGSLLTLPGEGRRDRFLRSLVPRRLRPKLHGYALRMLRP